MVNQKIFLNLNFNLHSSTLPRNLMPTDAFGIICNRVYVLEQQSLVLTPLFLDLLVSSNLLPGN